jgi:hypothetical protein
MSDETAALPANGQTNGRAVVPFVPTPFTPAGTDFKAVAIGTGANLEGLPAYFTDPLLATGNMPGIAISAFNNRAIRQATFVASSLCLWISDETQTYVPDDGSQINWIALWQQALADFVSALIPAGPDLGAYLPLAGGTMVGNILFQTGISTILNNNTWYFGRDTTGQARGLIVKSADNNVTINDGSSPNVIFNGVPVTQNNYSWSGRDTGNNIRRVIGLLSDNNIHIGNNLTANVYFDNTASVIYSENIVLTNNHYILGNDVGGIGRTMLGMSASNGILIGSGSIGPTDIYSGGGQPINLHNPTNVYGTFQTNGYAYLNAGTRCYIPSGNDPLQVYADAGYYARQHYIVGGTRDWSVGCQSNGPFAITDESAGAIRLQIDTAGTVTVYASGVVGGNWQINGAGSVYNGLTVYNNLNVASGNGYFAGSIVQCANITMSGSLNIAGMVWQNNGQQMYTPNPIWTASYINIGGVVWQNNGGYMYTGSPIYAGAGGYAVYAPSGSLYARGMYSTANIDVVSDAPGAGIGIISSYGGVVELQRGNNGNTWVWGHQADATTTWSFNTVDRMYLDQFGNLFAQSFNPSDRSLKEDIAEIREDVLPAIMRLKPVTFRYKGGDGTTRRGLVAQDVDEILPGAVILCTANETLALSYNDVLTALVKAVQELTLQVQELQNATIH